MRITRMFVSPINYTVLGSQYSYVCSLY